jgi:hypothetical protein
MSNILAMPLVELAVETSNNEDWVDSIVYYVDTGDIPPPQLDIRGIVFEMEIRRSASDHEVLLSASTANETLKIGAVPDFGYLLFNIPVTLMLRLIAGKYVGDITARDGQYTRTIATIGLTVVEGVTKQPVMTAA